METYTDQTPMPFGKHAGVVLERVPAGYLLWLWDKGVYQETTKPLHHYIKQNFHILETEADDYIVQHPPKS
jgi:uncharacterized protein (DUF3820 family)